MSIPNALTIAGSDSGGGAGVQADLKTFSAMRVYGASVITALTAQNTRTVAAVHDVPPDFVALQMRTVLDDLRIDAVKIGMLGRAAIVEAVAGALPADVPVVLDPVMVAKSGDRLLDVEAVRALRNVLLPRATVVTPNLPEAGDLLRRAPPSSEAEMVEAARALLELGPGAVLIKGGHLQGETSVDLLVDAEGVVSLPSERLETKNTHGTGCTLSAAIAAGLAHEKSLRSAAAVAKAYVAAAIAAADELDVGRGHGPVHHFTGLWSPPDRSSSA